MSEPPEDSARPAKRARLDGNAAPSLSTSVKTSEPAPQAAPTTPKAAIDQDLEREVRAGIREYVCPNNLGFKGVLKQRYTDFLVNEIGQDGVVVHLRSMEVPKREKKLDVRNGEEKKEAEMKEDKVVAEEEEEKVVIKKEDDEEVRAARNGARHIKIKMEDTSDEEDLKVKQEDGAQEEVKQEPEEEVCHILGCDTSRNANPL